MTTGYHSIRNLPLSPLSSAMAVVLTSALGAVLTAAVGSVTLAATHIFDHHTSGPTGSSRAHRWHPTGPVRTRRAAVKTLQQELGGARTSRLL